MTEDKLAELRDEYETLFGAPFASHEWASRRARSWWVDLEGWQDALAGPLSSIANTGGCEYVYSREDDYFAGVGDPISLRARLLEWLAGLVAGVERFEPHTPDETADVEYMQNLVVWMRALIARACDIEQHRWSRARGG